MTSPGPPDAADVHAAIVATTVRRSGSRLVGLAAEATVLLGAVGLAVMVVPYIATPTGTEIALADGGPLRDSTVMPRLVGIVISSAFAIAALLVHRWRSALFCTAGSALAATAAYGLWWAFGVRTGFGVPRRIGWYLDLVVAGLAIATIAVGVIGVRRSLAGLPGWLDRRLLPSMPYVAVATAVVAVATDWMLSRDPLFPTAFALGSEGVATDQAPASMRIVALLLAVLLVLVPVMAAVASERRIGQGLALGWPAVVAVLAARVLTTPGWSPHQAFTIALVIVGLATIALLVWFERSGRNPPFPARPIAAERRAHEPDG